MAKGWESKSVESQVQDVQSRVSRGSTNRLSPAQMDTLRRKEVLLLSRTRVERELQSINDPRYRDQLNRALSDLNEQLSALAEIA
ncbi:MAG TPA: hypothetical protein VN661_09570 [Candidatus Acidoferrales bacterium]|nr:hypothetical protein [Candidatus Acidoferrales bacterium]